LIIWAQIHRIPELYRKKEVVDDLARRIGRVEEVQMNAKPIFEGNIVHLRVRVEVSKPLLRFVSFTLSVGRKRLQVKYEKILKEHVSPN
jgi:sporulation protein YlmC with PRC-barrel domain